MGWPEGKRADFAARRHAGPFVHSAVPGIVWPGIPDVLNARVLALQYQLRVSQWWSPDELLERQLDQAGALIAHARATVPFYRETLSEAPRGPLDYEAFRRIPVLTRERLQRLGDRLMTESLPVEHGPASPVQTSGSTAQPVSAQETLLTRTMLKAMNQRLVLWHGLDHAGKLLSIRAHVADHARASAPSWGNGYATGPLVFLDVMTPLDEMLDRVVREEAQYVAAYPTIAQALARLAGERGLRLPGLAGILSFGETLSPSVRQDCARFLDAPVVDVYSAIETGVLALQCPSGQHYHVASESVLLEVLDDAGRPCAPGEVGRVVVTPLHNFATPLIRYDIGDYAETGPPCACGRGLPVLNRIMGRARNMLVLPSGERRWPFPAGADITKGSPVLQFQLLQLSLHELEMRVVSSQPLDSGQTARLREAVVRELGHPFDVRVMEVEGIQRSPSGKYEDFICRLQASDDRPGSSAPAGAHARGRSSGPAAHEPEHRLRIDGRWSVWRDVVLRGAGFPAEILEQLASAAVARSADALLAAQDRFDQALAAARKACYLQLSTRGCADVKGLRRTMAMLKKGRVPSAALAVPELRAQLDAAAAMERELEQARHAFDQAWQRETDVLSGNLRRLAADPRFREAVAWQNPNALVNGIEPWLRERAGDSARAVSQHRELLVARYLQRYAAKNDTIGFFGPVGWARIDDLETAWRFEPGEAIAVDPIVRLEPWAMRTLAEKISTDPALRPWLSPSPHPAHRREGEDIVLLERRLRLPVREQLVFDRCDGATPANFIAVQLAAGRSDVFPSEASVLETLERLAAARLIHWRLAIPLVAAPDDFLRNALTQLPAEAQTGSYLEAIERLAALKERARAAYGNADAVAEAMARLEREFESVSGSAAHHLPGELYGGRTLVYMDARRGASCALSEALILELGRALRPVLEAARWVSRQFFSQFSDFIDGVYEDCRRATGRVAVPLDTVWLEMQKRGEIVDAIREDAFEQLVERWSVVIPLPEGERRVELRSDELTPRLGEAFSDAAPGWPGARFQSPDIMLAADSVKAVEEGRYRLVLGELHPATRSLLQPLFLDMHSRAEDLQRAAASERPEPELRIAIRTENAIYRNGQNPDSPVDFEIECDESRAALPRERVIPSGALLIERGAEGLVLRTPDGKHTFPMAAFVGSQTTTFLRNQFSLFADVAHTPRVTIDRLVVQRERWQVPLESLAFADRGTRVERFLGARLWAMSLGLPQRSFYRLPGGAKPIYLDLESPVYVDVFARLLRAARASRAKTISITEMLPGLDEAPLTGPGGKRYTSEFRMVFVDRS